MSAEQSVYAALSAAAGVTVYTSDRIYAQNVPVEKTLPAISVRRVGTEYVQTIHTATPVASQASIEIACMTAKVLDAHLLADAAEAALATIEMVAEDRVFQEDTEQGLFAVILLVKVWQ